MAIKKEVKKEGFMPHEDLPLTKENYLLIIAGFVIIIIGLFLMSGSTDINDARKLIVAPIVMVAGFVFEIYAIMKSPKNNSNTQE
jgi:hypothetical protein